MTVGNILIPVMLVVAGLAGCPALAGDGRDVIHITSGGELGLELRADYLGDFGIEAMHDNSAGSGRSRVRAGLRDGLEVAISPGQFGQFISGRMQAETGLTLRFGQAEVKLEAMDLVPGEDNGRPVIEIRDRGGLHLLSITHVHVALRADEGRIEIRHGDLVARPALAKALGAETLAGMVIGNAWLDLAVVGSRAGEDQLLVSEDDSRGLSCEERPFWPQDGHSVDVALTDIGVVQYQGTKSGTELDNGWVKLAPSATLKNVSNGDVPWIAKFEENQSLYPYSPPDQHPYLVWSLYRIHDGRIEQLAVSGAKHAFNTINRNCDLSCGYLSGDVLGPGCEDDYGAETNDQNDLMGPRDEIQASRGLFFSTGSFFDPGSTGSQTESSEEFENRLLVDPAELEIEGAEYFVDAWYVIQCDADIWNSMGYRQVDPEAGQSGGWEFDFVDKYRDGPVVREWIAEGQEALSSHVVMTVPSENLSAGCPDGMPQGHIRVLVNVEDLGDDQYRYRYALQNFDLDRGIERIRLPVGAGADADGLATVSPNDSGDWAIGRGACQIEIDKDQAGGDWMTLNNFEFDTSAPPVAGTLAVELAGDASPDVLWVDTLVPSAGGSVFCDEFADRPTEQ